MEGTHAPHSCGVSSIITKGTQVSNRQGSSYQEAGVLKTSALRHITVTEEGKRGRHGAPHASKLSAPQRQGRTVPILMESA